METKKWKQRKVYSDANERKSIKQCYFTPVHNHPR